MSKGFTGPFFFLLSEGDSLKGEICKQLWSKISGAEREDIFICSVIKQNYFTQVQETISTAPSPLGKVPPQYRCMPPSQAVALVQRQGVPGLVHILGHQGGRWQRGETSSQGQTSGEVWAEVTRDWRNPCPIGRPSSIKRPTPSLQPWAATLLSREFLQQAQTLFGDTRTQGREKNGFGDSTQCRLSAG